MWTQGLGGAHEHDQAEEQDCKVQLSVRHRGRMQVGAQKQRGGDDRHEHGAPEAEPRRGIGCGSAASSRAAAAQQNRV